MIRSEDQFSYRRFVSREGDGVAQNDEVHDMPA